MMPKWDFSGGKGGKVCDRYSMNVNICIYMCTSIYVFDLDILHLNYYVYMDILNQRLPGDYKVCLL